MLSNDLPIKVAVVGLGYWGPNLLRNFSLIKNVDVVYGCDLIKSNLDKLKPIYPLVKFTSDFKTILKDKTIDAVAIATPVSTHYDLAKKALKAKKHVLLEKPMTSTSKEAKELIDLAKTNKRILMIGYTFVYSESVRKIKELVDKNQLGKIFYYDSTRINLGLLQKDMNVIWDLACHDLSILNFIFSIRPKSVQAFGSKFINGKNYEIANIIISYEKNITAHINVSWLSPVKLRSIIVGGSKKMIVWNDIEPSEKIKIYDKGIIQSDITPFTPAYRSGDVLIPNISQTEPLYNELVHLIDCIKNNRQPLTSGEEGLKILRILEASNKSLKSKSSIKL